MNTNQLAGLMITLVLAKSVMLVHYMTDHHERITRLEEKTK